MTSRRRRAWSDRTTALLSLGALAWVIFVGAVLLVAPTYRTTKSVSTPTGEVTTTSTESLLDHEGPGVALILLAPVVVTLVGALGSGPSARARRIGAGAVLMAACLLAAASIGLAYVPAPLLLLAAGVRTERATRPPTARAGAPGA